MNNQGRVRLLVVSDNSRCARAITCAFVEVAARAPPRRSRWRRAWRWVQGSRCARALACGGAFRCARRRLDVAEPRPVHSCIVIVVKATPTPRLPRRQQPVTMGLLDGQRLSDDRPSGCGHRGGAGRRNSTSIGQAPHHQHAVGREPRAGNILATDPLHPHDKRPDARLFDAGRNRSSLNRTRATSSWASRKPEYQRNGTIRRSSRPWTIMATFARAQNVPPQLDVLIVDNLDATQEQLAVVVPGSTSTSSHPLLLDRPNRFGPEQLNRQQKSSSTQE